MISGMQDVYYNVQDMRRGVEFYRDVLGLKLIRENEYWAAFDVGGTRFALHWTGGAAVPRGSRDVHGSFVGATVTFRVADIAAAVQRLRSAGVMLPGAISDNPWGKLAVFEDPDGNVLKLMQPPA